MVNTFVLSKFSYFPLIWMFHDRCNDRKLKKINERAIWISYKDSHSCFESLLERNNSVSLRQKNLQLFLIEIFKTKKSLYPSFMESVIVERKENHNLRKTGRGALQLPKVQTISCWIESVSFLGKQLWHARKSEAIRKLLQYSKWKEFERPRLQHRLCKIYIADLGMCS